LNQADRIRLTVGQPLIFKIEAVKRKASFIDGIDPHRIYRAHGHAMAALQRTITGYLRLALLHADRLGWAYFDA
jgi:hypothetical protein